MRRISDRLFTRIVSIAATPIGLALLLNGRSA